MRPRLTIDRRPFGVMPGGAPVEQFVLALGTELELRAITLGAIVTSMAVADGHGHPVQVVLGYDVLTPYLTNRAYLGALVGRFANRIAHGRFSLDGAVHQLATNDGAHHLHGGARGFDTHLWDASIIQEVDRVGVCFARSSAAGEEGYPGRLQVTATYSLHANGAIAFDYEARTDAPTIINLTQHTYFNLAGAGTILDHELMLDSDRFTPVGEGLIPTGQVVPVAGTPFDFRTTAAIGDRIDEADDQLRVGRGYDHNWVLRRSGPGLLHAATLRDPASGRTLDLFTTEPGVHFYSGNLLQGSSERSGDGFMRHGGLCLETQHFPDSPNHPHFPSTVLRPSEYFHSSTVWRFTVT